MKNLTSLLIIIVSVTTFALPANAETVLMHKGITALELKKAEVIKLPPGQSFGSLSSTLTDDQIIEMPSGTRMKVGSIRALQVAFAKAKQRASVKAPAGFKILPAPAKPGVAIKPGETAAEILARPNSDVVTFPSGRTASVAQLKAMAPYIQKHYGVDLLHPGTSGRPNLNGKALLISSLEDLKKIPKDAPASTILETSKGTRITLGELRTAISNSKSGASAVNPSGESK